MVKLHLKSPSLLECFYAKYFTMFAWKSKGEGGGVNFFGSINK